MNNTERTGWLYTLVAAGVLALVLVLANACCSAQVAADADMAWRGLCHEQAQLQDCGCGPRGEKFDAAQVALRLRLIDERLERLGKTCDSYMP